VLALPGIIIAIEEGALFGQDEARSLAGRRELDRCQRNRELSHSLGPTNHCALALGSANALNTSAGEALKVRSTTKVACTTDDLAMDYAFAFDSVRYRSSRSSRRSQMLRR